MQRRLQRNLWCASSTPTTCTGNTLFSTRASSIASRTFVSTSKRLILTTSSPLNSLPRHLAKRRSYASAKVEVDDVSRFNTRKVQRVFYPIKVQDLQAILKEATQSGRTVSLRGQSHTMGGHTIAEDGYLLDMRFFNKMKYNPPSSSQAKDWGTLTVQSGATWGEMIKFLNRFGLSPTTMQSYCSFSVGGTLSVNAHGITTDNTMAESVVAMTIVDSQGNVHKCDPSSDLFRHALGGYGLFGVIADATVKVVPNVNVRLERTTLKASEFKQHYSNSCLDDPSIDVKLARINVAHLLEGTPKGDEDINLFIFRKSHALPTVAHLPPKPRELSISGRLMYKWLTPLPFFQRLRYKLEEAYGVPLDWHNGGGGNGIAEETRNSLMFESAVPLSQLYEPLIRMDHTFILQEYFIPHEKFEDWMTHLRHTLQQQKDNKDKDIDLLQLLNITIRYVKKDDVTRLPYAPFNAFAFVMYYRLPRNRSAEAQLARVHNRLVEGALGMGGTFYLPYLHHYTPDQFQKAYPGAQSFFKAKQQYDPTHTLRNMWFDRYSGATPTTTTTPTTLVLPPLVERPGGVVPVVQARRKDSFKKVFDGRDPALRDAFDEFMQDVFNIGKSNRRRLVELIVKEVHNNNNHNDNNDNSDTKVHQGASDKFSKNSNMLSNVVLKGMLLKQLVEQRHEITREALRVIDSLGYRDSIRSYVSIGDRGRLANSLAKELPTLKKGHVIILHDEEPSFVMDSLERGSLQIPGMSKTNLTRYPFSYMDVHPVRGLDDDSADLVTCNMGLHHFDQEKQLPKFLEEVWRMLKPGGLFITREHDARPELVPLLDIAHEVFNIATGVKPSVNEQEIRAFRPVEQWRALLRQQGFEDTMTFEMQPGDSTEDYMMCFRKPVTAPSTLKKKMQEEGILNSWNAKMKPRDSTISDYGFCEWSLVECTQLYGRFLEKEPWYRFPYMGWLGFYWKSLGKTMKDSIQNRGLKRAMGSGLLMDAVIGGITSLLFTQLAILALPLRLALGSEYDPTNVMHIVVESSKPVDWQSIDGRIECLDTFTHETDKDKSSMLYSLKVPRYTPFTEILIKLAHADPTYHLNLKEINGCRDELQLRISSGDEPIGTKDNKKVSTVPWLTKEEQEKMGARMRWTFKIPGRAIADGKDEEEATLSASVRDILPAIRELHRKGAKIQQIYDF